MTKAAKSVYFFLDDHLGLYDNPHGLEFCMNVDDSVFVITPLSPSPEPYVDFGLFYNSRPFKTFVRDFHFAGAESLKNLTQGHLWKMYDAGQVEIYCTIVVKVIFFALYFRLTRHNTMIVRDDYDQEYELHTVFTRPNQFVEYTQQQFLRQEG